MTQPQAYLNGRLMPAAEVAVQVFDAGFVQGTTVAEQLRTFGGRLFRLEMHVERLFHSLAIVGVDPGHSRDEFCAMARRAGGLESCLAGAGRRPGPVDVRDARGPTRR